MICVAYKFDDSKMEFLSEWNDGRDLMVDVVYEAIVEADAVVHFNGTSFDERHLNREFLQRGLGPPERPLTIDLYRAIKNRFYFASNKLAQVTKQLEIRDGKIKTDFDLWRDVLAGDPKAQRQMEKYNKEDVYLLEELYNVVLPWIDRHPNVALYEDDELMRCTRCGSTELSKAGTQRTTAGKFQRYQCKDCGSYSRGSKRIGTTPLREA